MAYKKRTPIVRKTGAQKRRASRRRVVLYVVLVSIVAIIATAIYILNQPQLRIGEVRVVGTQVLAKQDILDEVSKITSVSVLGMFPQDSIAWYPHDVIEETLVNKHPEIRTIDISIDDFDVLVITLEERTSEYYLQTASGTYGIDHDGVVFHQNKEAVSASSSRTFSSYAYDTEDVVLGTTIQGIDSFGDFNSFLDELESLGIAISRVRFENSILTILEMSTGPRIIVYPENDHTSVISTLREIMGYKEFGFDRRTHAFKAPLEYINLRFGSKIFYCYAQDECATEYQIDKYEG